MPSVWAAEQPLPATDLLLSWAGAAWPRKLPPHHQSSGARGPRRCYECLCSARCGRSTCWPNKRAVTVHLCPDTEVSFSMTKQETGSRRGQAERWLRRLSPRSWGHSSEVTVPQLGAICSNKWGRQPSIVQLRACCLNPHQQNQVVGIFQQVF